MTIESIPKSAYLLDEPDLEDDEEYSLASSMIILKGECHLYGDANENGIRSEFVKLFKTKLPFVTNIDFDFVRRNRNTISSPLVKEDHVCDFKHVKHVCGNGRFMAGLISATTHLSRMKKRKTCSHQITLLVVSPRHQLLLL